MPNEDGTIEAIRKDKTAMKIKDRDGWINFKNNVLPFAKDLEAGYNVEFAEDGSFVKTIEPYPEEQKKILPSQSKQTTYSPQPIKKESEAFSLMEECLADAEKLYNSEKLGKEFKERISWDDIAITLFITRSERR